MFISSLCRCPPFKVIADMDEEGPIGVVDTALATPSSLDKTHPKQELSRPPGWWSKRCVGDRCVTGGLVSINTFRHARSREA